MRLFVAVWPPPPVTARLAAIDRTVRPGVRWATEDQWHVTLCFLGAVDDDQVEGVKAALGRLDPVGRGEPVLAIAGPALVRLGRAVLAIPVAGLDELAGAVVARTRDVGTAPQDRPFRGHLTIARAKGGVDLRPPGPVPFSASWQVDEVTLVASTRHPDGARYQVIGRYLLVPERP